MRRLGLLGMALFLTLGSLTALAPAKGSQKQKGKQTAQAAAATGQDTTSVSAAEESSYIIGPQDVLDINVWKEPEVSRTVPVRPDGKISLPLLNDVQASGLTPMQLQATITEGLKKFITGPQVTVIVREINSRRVYVLGEVARPGAFPMIPNMTVLQALSTAGGFGQFAKLNGIYVLRTENGKQMTYPFNYKDVVRGQRAEQNIVLRPGDTIVVP
ncbi:MAG: polysaccharide biosynthesis/export family protein [Acidobacteriia bacterium]|nr:polysaccharide biosynthesis/export family protein [Terriglobia bacterium]